MRSSFSNQFLRWVLVAFAAAAFAPPAAQARHAPGENPGTTSPQHSLAASKDDSPAQWHASPFEVDRLGPKNVALHHPQPPMNVIVKVVEPAGFKWADAAIGAGVASLALALVAGLALVVGRRSRKAILSEGSELAGA